MSDANELLAAMIEAIEVDQFNSLAMNRVRKVWPLLRTHCKAGNLPDEWTINIVRMTLEDVRVTQRIAALEVEVERLRAVAARARLILADGPYMSVRWIRHGQALAEVLATLDAKEATDG